VEILKMLESYTTASGQYVDYNDPNRKDHRKVTDGKPRGWQISKMWENHHEIARHILLGEKNVDIAKQMKCNVSTVAAVRNSPIVKDKLAIMAAARDVDTVNLAKEILDLAPIAIARVKEALTEGKVLNKELSASGILKEANAILDRQIGKPTQTINTQNIHGHFTLDDLDRIKQKAGILKPPQDSPQSHGI